MSYILSIIIPTRNRNYYCFSAVKQILSLNLPNVQICVQDNSDNDELSSELIRLGNSNVVYNYHPGVLSFVDNFSEAVSLACGEYICMIGDDDGILPNIVKYTKMAKEESYDAIIPELGMIYFWPSKKNIVTDSSNGLLQVSLKKSLQVTPVDSKHALKILLHNAVQNYTSLDIPRLYHGLVKRDVLERIKKKTGKYFDGLTPDMYMATTLAIECKKTMRTSESFTISGICPTSGSADSATGRHTGNLKDAPHFRGHDNYKWNTLIPTFYSVDTIWAETLLHALDSYKEVELIDKFNLPLFEAICLKKYPQFLELLQSHCKVNGVTKVSMLSSYIAYKFPELLFRICKKITSFISCKESIKSCKIYGVQNIEEAEAKILDFTS